VRAREALEDSERFAKKVLACDGSIEWVTVISKKGEKLAHVRSRLYPPGPVVSDNTIARLAALDSVALPAFGQAEKWYGRMDYVLLAHEKGQIILTRGRSGGLIIAAKTQRSQNAEYIFAKVKSALAESST
jgi:hypothetical protein